MPTENLSPNTGRAQTLPTHDHPPYTSPALAGTQPRAHTPRPLPALGGDPWPQVDAAPQHTAPTSSPPTRATAQTTPGTTTPAEAPPPPAGTTPTTAPSAPNGRPASTKANTSPAGAATHPSPAPTGT